MHGAHRVDPGYRPAPSKSRVNKFVAAGVAVMGAGAIAANPISPASPVSPEIRDAAVALTAAADPIELFQQFFAEAQTNLALLQLNGGNSSEAMAEAFSNADLLGELTTIIAANASDPLPLVTRLLNLQAVYGDDLEVALFGRDAIPAVPATSTTPAIPAAAAYEGVFQRIQGSIEDFGPTIADILTYDPPATDPTQSPLTNAVFEANFYFVFGLLDPLRPLIGATPGNPYPIVPLFSMPGDFLGGEVLGGFDGGLPGFEPGVDDPSTPNVNEALTTGTRLDNLINVFNEQTLTRAVTGPFQTVAFQIAQSIDDATAAYNAGDTELAANELSNLPIRAVNALVNGFTPSFSTCTGVNCSAEWPSLIDATQTQPGLLKYLAVDLPNQITAALGGTTPTYVTTPPATTGLTQASKVDPLAGFGPAKDSVTLTVEKAPEPEAKTKAVSTDTDEVIEKATPAKKKTTSTFGTKTQEALKKAGDDLNKAVTNVFKPKKKESTTGASTTAGATADADKDTSDSEKSDKE